MKYIAILILAVFCLNTGNTQYTDEYPAMISGQYYEDEVILRWVPKTYDTWEEGMERGYTVDRYTISDVNGVLTLDDLLASKVTIASNLKPISVSQWDNTNFPDAETSGAAKHLLYSEEFNPSFTPSSFEEVVNVNDTRANRYTFSLMVADRYFELSSAMALGHKDATIDDKSKYKYTLSFSDDPSESIAICMVDIPNAKELEKVKGIKTAGADKLAVIEWDVTHASRFYTSYLIERSTDGVLFTQVNDIPYIYGVDAKSQTNPGKAYYKDTLPQNGVEYFYRLVGQSPFGIQGPPSDPVKCIGVPGRMDITLSIALAEEETDQITIKWGGIEDDQTNDIEKFEIYRSTKIYDEYEKINATTLGKEERFFTDFNPLYSGYYMITMYDVNGHYYKSRAILAQPSDMTPPAIPSGLAGEASKEGVITLDWGDNYEEDFQGYRVFRSNLRTANFVDISGEDIEISGYIDVIPTNMTTDTVFYAIKSSDIRGNHSEFSEILALARPNKVPPSQAVLHNLMPTNEGVKILWALSESSDLKQHVLQRKPRDGSGWTDVVVIEKGSPLESQQFGDDLMKYNYIDDEDLEPIVFQYRILAEDNSGNQSLSNMLEIQPLVNNIYGEIINFEGNVSCQAQNNGTLTNQINSLEQASQAIASDPTNANSILLGLLQQGLISYNEYANLLNNSQATNTSVSTSLNNQIDQLNILMAEQDCIVFLTWDYKRDDIDVDYVEVFRATDSEPMDLYKLYRPLDLVVNDNPSMALIDDDVENILRYEYKLIVYLKDGTNSPISEKIELVINP